MSDFEQAVFISYAWGGEREEIVNQIDQTLQQRGIKIIRDKRDLGYKGSISEFMERIGRGNCVIVVVSDKYLRSPNCMFELVEIADGTQFHDRIFPVVLNDADIYDPVKRAEYVQYWEIKRKELAKAMKKLDPANLQGIREDMDLYDRIRDRISGLTSILKDMNTLTLDIHRDSDFSDLYDAIEKRLGESSPPPIIKTLELQPFEPETIEIPAGPFKMGCNASEGIPKYETPEHEVDIPEFRMGCRLVTNLQYLDFVSARGIVVPQIMRWKGQLIPDGRDGEPALGVSWEDAMQYCEWLSEKTGRKYSLPNEAQWEKARRGSYPCSEDMGKVLEWTCSLWGERRNEPDARYRYPWKKDDGRNNPNANSQIRRVLRGFTGADETGIRRSCARYGRAVDDPGFGEVRYGFRVILNI
jgi:formylglycine-generating enzyme required for sulfatase activity